MKFTTEEANQIFNQIQFTKYNEDLPTNGMIIEAIEEDLGAKSF
jgi:3-hydroxyacyl-CoA dehydrogenase